MIVPTEMPRWASPLCALVPLARPLFFLGDNVPNMKELE